MPNLLELIVTNNVTLLPAATSATGLGDLVLVGPQGVVAGAGKFTVVTSADVAALLTATNITTEFADAINLALQQNPHPPYIRIITYLTTALDSALAIMKAELSWSPGVIVIYGANDVADEIEDIGTFVAENPWKYFTIFESPNAGLLTANKPAALSDLESISEIYVMKVVSAVDDPSYGAGFGSLVASRQMVGPSGGPIGSRMRILGVDADTSTSTQLGYLIANGAGTVLQLDAGNSSTERVVYGTNTYSDEGLTPVTSMLFAVKLVGNSIRDLILNKAILQDPILATPEGGAEVEAAVNKNLDIMANAGKSHFVKTKEYPRGYLVTATILGDEIFAMVSLRLPQEVRDFTFNMLGEIV